MSVGRNWVWIVVVNQPPLVERAGIVSSALRIVDVEPLLATPLVATVLMNRTVTNANSTPMFRELMTDEGHTVLSTTIPRREPIAQAFGGPVTDLGK